MAAELSVALLSQAGDESFGRSDRNMGRGEVDDPAPPWMQRLALDFEAYAAAAPAPVGGHSADPFGKLLAPLTPLILSARQRLRDGLAAVPISSTDEVDLKSLDSHLLAHLLAQLSRLSARCVVLQMHRARQAHELVGDTPEEQFDYFTQQLADPQRACEFLASYPVLARQASIAVEQWLTASLEFAKRFAADWRSLQQQFFSGQSPGRVVEIQGGSGDLHRGGRSVMVVTLAGGQRLVYKPRSLAVEAHFQDLVAWLNQRGAKHPLRQLCILDRGAYGWVEFVPQTDAADGSAVERFYHRLGSFAALAYLLSGTDLHAENLLAHGEHPVLIDLEALFHHRLPGVRKDAAALGLTHSVLALQMLPVVSYVQGFEQPIDFSGMGATAGVPTPFRAPVWENIGRTDMRLGEATVETPPSSHCPTLAGRPVSYRGHQAAFLAGFADAYEILCQNQRELLSPTGPLAPFAGDEARFIARPTQVYGILLEQTLHPEAMASADVRNRLLSRLESRTRDFPCLAQALPHELADLDRNDVPLFTVAVRGCDLVTSTGELVERYFPESAWDLVQQRVRQLSQADLARQTWLIQAAFAVAGHAASPAPAYGDDLEAAERIGDRLLELAHHTGPDIGWITVHPRGRGWSIGPAGCDVAAGQAGIALFLAHLALYTGRSDFARIARQTARAIVDRLDWDPAQRDAAGRAPEALFELARLWNEPELERRTRELFGDVLAPSNDDPFAVAWGLVETDSADTFADTEMAQDRFELPGLRGGLAGKGMRILARCHGLTR